MQYSTADVGEPEPTDRRRAQANDCAASYHSAPAQRKLRVRWSSPRLSVSHNTSRRNSTSIPSHRIASQHTTPHHNLSILLQTRSRLVRDTRRRLLGSSLHASCLTLVRTHVRAHLPSQSRHRVGRKRCGSVTSFPRFSTKGRPIHKCLSALHNTFHPGRPTHTTADIALLSHTWCTSIDASYRLGNLSDHLYASRLRTVS